jgi:small subunit ribosomal protein S6
LAEYVHDPRPYELMVLLTPELADEALAAEIDSVSNLISDAGAEVKGVKSTTPWGRRRLAYPIQKHVDATYVLYDLASQPEQISEFERELKLNERVIRYLLVRQDEVEAEDEGDADAADDADESQTEVEAESEEPVEVEAEA